MGGVDAVLGLDGVELALLAILGGVAHGVAAVPVGDGLEEHGTVAGAGVLDGLADIPVDLFDVEAIELPAHHAHAIAATRHVGEVGLALQGGAHGVAVVLAEVDRGELPQLGQLEGFEERSLLGRAVAEVGKRNLVLIQVLASERRARTQRHMTPDDAIATVEVVRLAGEVHGATDTLGDAGCLAKQLGHYRPGADTLGHDLTVIAVGGDHSVFVTKCSGGAHTHGFLADVQVTEALDLAERVRFCRKLLDPSDQHHLTRPGEELFFGDFVGRVGQDCGGVCH